MRTGMALVAAVVGWLGLALGAAGAEPGAQGVGDVVAKVGRLTAVDSREPFRELERRVAAVRADAAARRQVADAIVKGALSADNADEGRRLLLWQLPLVADAEVAGALLPLLKTSLAVEARGVLEAIPGEEVSAVLRKAAEVAEGAEPKVLAGLLATLAVRGDKAAAPLAVKGLESGEVIVRGAAVWALGRLATDEGAEALLRKLEKVEAGEKVAVAEALLACTRGASAGVADRARARLAKEDVAEPVRLGAMAATLAAGGKVEPIVAAATGKSEIEQVAAIEALRLANKGEWTVEVAKAPGLSLEARRSVLAMLVEQKWPTAAPLFVQGLGDADPAVRQLSVRGIGSVGDEKAVEPLLGLVPGAQARDAEAITAALTQLKGEGVGPKLLAALEREETAAAMVPVVVGRGMREAVPALLKLAEGTNERLANDAIKGVGEVADATAIPSLIGLLGKRAGQEAAIAGALVSIVKRGGRDVGPVIAAYEKGSSEVKRSLMGVLAAVGGEKSLAVIRRELESGDTALRAEAVRSLSTWPDPAALPDLLNVARKGGVTAERALALRGIARLLPAEAASAGSKAGTLAFCVKLAADAATRNALMAAAGEIPDVVSVQAAADMLADPAVAPAAALAIVKLSASVKGQDAEVRKALQAVVGATVPKNVADQARRRLRELGAKGEAPGVVERVILADAAAARPAVTFKRDERSFAATIGEQVVWRFNYGPNIGKTHFDPCGPAGGPSVTWASPADHVWHYGLWFSWKLINGVNYWEEEPKQEKRTRWSEPKFDTRADGAATIALDLEYSPTAGDPVVMTERRRIEVSAIAADGSYAMDWTLAFTAKVDLTLDRTPPPGKPGGVGHGGYAGLSIRLQQPAEPRAITPAGPVEFNKENRFRANAPACEYQGKLDGKEFGIAFLDHPGNASAPSPWYVIRGKPMFYMNAAVLLEEPLRMKAGETMTLRYRVVVHNGAWDAAKLDAAAKEFAKATGNTKE